MAVAVDSFEQRISDLDVGLFDAIVTQTSKNDRQSLLACQLATRDLTGGYGYLEIGSYLGGSIQPHLLDPLCRHIYSIDKRPAKQPDNRGITANYKNNSTERMLKNLAELDADQLEKITCFDADTSELDPNELEHQVNLCLIDGEHTDEAVIRDFEYCLAVIGDRGAIIAHDAQLLYNGLLEVVRRLEESGRDFHAYNLPDGLMVFEIGRFPLHEQSFIAARLLDNHVGYLNSMLSVESFRRWANIPPLRAIRAIRLRLKGIRYCE